MKKPFRSRRGIHICLLAFGLLCLGLLFYILARQGIGIPCLFHKITGFQCPGCGNSRAVLALLRLDILGALQHNLLFPLEFGYIAWVGIFCCAQYLRGNRFAYRPPCPWIDTVILIIVILWGFVRNMI